MVGVPGGVRGRPASPFRAASDLLIQLIAAMLRRGYALKAMDVQMVMDRRVIRAAES
jgi:hypothetical protein